MSASELISSFSALKSPIQRISATEDALRAMIAERAPYGKTLSSYVQPNYGKSVIIPVTSTAWMAIGLGIYVSTKTTGNPIGGYYYVEAIVSSTNVLARRTGDVSSPGAAEASTIPSGSTVTVGVSFLKADDPNAIRVESSQAGQLEVYWKSTTNWTLVNVYNVSTPTIIERQLWIPPQEASIIFAGLPTGQYFIKICHMLNGRNGTITTVDNAGSGYSVS
jgi:hypothetical protein